MYEHSRRTISWGELEMRILILTNRNTGNVYLVNKISSMFNVIGRVILEVKPKDRSEKWAFWKKRVKRYGILKTVNKYLFLKIKRNEKNDSIIKKLYFHPDTEKINYRYDSDEMITYDINSKEVENFIRSKCPDIIIVCGSNIIKPNIFEIPLKGTINIHCGITPDYRSANPVEWAIYNRDFQKIGVTIHYVDEGLDTGNIISQKTVKVEKGDSVTSLYCKNIVNGGELMIRAIQDISENRVNTFPQDLQKGRHYLSVNYGLLQHIKVKKILRSVYSHQK